MSDARLRVAFVSPGLGLVARGYETSSARLFEAVKAHAGDVHARLFAGGRADGAETIPMAAPLVRRIDRWTRQRYALVARAFAVALLPRLVAWRPHAVWTKSRIVANLLVAARDALRLGFVVVVANGGPLSTHALARYDFVQQLHPGGLAVGLATGLAAERMTVVPNVGWSAPASAPREALRRALGYDDDAFVIACVAAWNQRWKRLDYLVREVHALGDRRARLLVCGDAGAGSEGLRARASELLGERVRFATLPHAGVFDALRAADVFVSASLDEGFGQAILEARLVGRPMIVHPHASARFIVDDDAEALCDLSRDGALTTRLAEMRAAPIDRARLEDAAARARVRFSPEAIAGEAQRMLARAVALGPRAR